jgi:hypothetical protein
MEDAMSATKMDLKFTVSGMVTEYKGHNFILLEPGPEEIGRQILAQAPQNASHAQPTADQLLDEMLKQDAQPPTARPGKLMPPAVDTTSGSAAVAPGAPVTTVLREGSPIIDRVCRLTRSADGQQEELAFDSDGAAMQDPPVIILPNLKLSAIEGAASGDNHDPRFSVSGVIAEYRGRNYILLQKVVVMPESARQF